MLCFFGHTPTPRNEPSIWCEVACPWTLPRFVALTVQVFSILLDWLIQLCEQAAPWFPLFPCNPWNCFIYQQLFTRSLVCHFRSLRGAGKRGFPGAKCNLCCILNSGHLLCTPLFLVFLFFLLRKNKSCKIIMLWSSSWWLRLCWKVYAGLGL